MPDLIKDLALILVCAGGMTLVFKWLRQPLVLGYIVAGFIAGPHLDLTPSVIDNENVETWADIGVIVLLFALGLEFSVKKMFKVGSTAVITALTIMGGMIATGVIVGALFGWQKMDCLFLGGMIAMSSTTIIFKAFTDLGLRQKRFAQLVLSVLILEDILAIVLMVVLSTLSATGNFAGGELAYGLMKMCFFLVLWFTMGIYAIPAFLRHTRRLMSNETQLVVALALCFGMAIVASSVGFSPAFGAFIMGSILSETVEAEKIEHLVEPVKDLFGAVFFVSVGMMVDPSMIAQYWLPILVITVTVIVGQSFFGTLGVLLSGRSLKTAVQSGLSLTQIGEFAFIIASLGVTLGVTSDFLYPVVVAVSVITTFLTPYMIRLSDPVLHFLEAHLPQRVQAYVKQNAGARTINEEPKWHKLMFAIVRTSVLNLVISVAWVLLCIKYLQPFVAGIFPGSWGNVLLAVIMMLGLAPFARSIIVAHTGSGEFRELWSESRSHRIKLIATIVLRIMIVGHLTMYALSQCVSMSFGMLTGVAIVAIAITLMSKHVKKQSSAIELTFVRNLNSRDAAAEMRGEKKPSYEGRLLDHDLHLTDFEVPATSCWAGRTLMDLGIGRQTGAHVVSVLRGAMRHNIPGGKTRIYPGDVLQVIGTDDQISLFQTALNGSVETVERRHEPATLRCIEILDGSPFLGRTVINSRSREDYHCLIVGVERDGESLHAPTHDEVFRLGDVVWIVGEPGDLYRLLPSRHGGVR